MKKKLKNVKDAGLFKLNSRKSAATYKLNKKSKGVGYFSSVKSEYTYKKPLSTIVFV